VAKFYSRLDDSLTNFIQRQHVFFVATAPKHGRINLSPKGMDCFRCLDEHTVAYLDVTGSGNETAAHLLDDGRITIMFCSFDAEPRILRLYGTGQSVKPQDPRWLALYNRFPPLKGTRQIFVLQIDGVQTSCGFGVPVMEYRGDRETLQTWAERKGDQGIQDYWRERNRKSIDGLPTGLPGDDSPPEH
jgi:hypothetical protein